MVLHAPLPRREPRRAITVIGQCSMPLSLAWHVSAQLAYALLYLHFGFHEGGVEQEWPFMTHQDLHANNIVLSGGRGVYKDYPDAVLADFGKALFVDRTTADEATRDAALLRQHRDIEALVCELEVLALRVSDADGAFSKAVEVMGNVKRPRAGAKRNEHAFKVLRGFVKYAEERREASYEPLSRKLAGHFNKEAVSDGELRQAFPELETKGSFHRSFLR